MNCPDCGDEIGVAARCAPCATRRVAEAFPARRAFAPPPPPPPHECVAIHFTRCHICGHQMAEKPPEGKKRAPAKGARKKRA